MLKSIKVRDYMTTHLVTFKADMDLFEAIATLQEHKISGAPVIDDNGRLIGMLSEGDCLTGVIKDIYYKEAGGRVGDFMTTEVATIGPEDDIVDIAVLFNEKRRRRFPVIDDEQLVGQISQRDILRAVMEFNRETGQS